MSNGLFQTLSQDAVRSQESPQTTRDSEHMHWSPTMVAPAWNDGAIDAAQRNAKPRREVHTANSIVSSLSH